MNRFKTMPLRLRLTWLMGSILSFACTVLIVTSIAAARQIYDDMPRTRGISVDDPRVGAIPVPIIRVTPDHDFTTVSIISALLVLVVGTALTYIIAGKALKPVTSLSREIEEIDENNLFRQVQVPPSNDEVSRLSLSFNHMVQKLEKAFVTQKQFSANAAHELKTPLTAMIANIEVLQLDDEPSLDEYKETLDDTLRNAQRLSALVNDLLRMNAELHTLNREKFEAQAMLEELLEEHRQAWQSKSLRIETSGGDLLLYGERQLLQRTFSNLIQNAIKYSKPGGVVKLAVAETEDRTRLTIMDTGSGIPEEHLERIFEPFYCVDKSRSRELGGSGLGLSIVKAVIEKHGGDIQVQSVVDVFTSFVVTLPRESEGPTTTNSNQRAVKDGNSAFGFS
ncbi:sensor histidine kinase [Paenibacillus koleovorans]|uniref:sensor histidine kinase n=1 Tax=Paenibacillus koleovorans TaxID=121608 RepID=UPI000FDB1833|nr:ATP-binding protein [Paenibacillus koleovorans]